MSPADLARFETKFVKTDGCWLWTDFLSNDADYGRFKAGGEIVKAHRFSYRAYNGQIPEGLCVLHRCDRPACVNPSHLFLGTQLDNIKDRTLKGRSDRLGKAKGRSHYKAKLSVEQVKAIALDGRTQRVIAQDYGLGQAQVSRIKHGQHWAFR